MAKAQGIDDLQKSHKKEQKSLQQKVSTLEKEIASHEQRNKAREAEDAPMKSQINKLKAELKKEKKSAEEGKKSQQELIHKMNGEIKELKEQKSEVMISTHLLYQFINKNMEKMIGFYIPSVFLLQLINLHFDVFLQRVEIIESVKISPENKKAQSKWMSPITHGVGVAVGAVLGSLVQQTISN